MPPVIVTADNIPDVLSQIAERQDEQAAAIELLAEQLADQSIRTEQQDEALRTQAAALRVTTAQLSRNISDVAKAAGGNGARATGNRSANQAADTNGADANGDDDDGIDDSDGRVTPIRRGTTTARSPANGVTKPVEAKAKPPAEPAAPARKRAHRWI